VFPQRSESRQCGRLPSFCLAWNDKFEDEPRFSELLLAFNANGVEYLVVGAHALAAYGHVRATKDLDVWIRANEKNARKVLQAISEFGAPSGDLTADDLSNPGTVFQIGIPPLRIDIITEIDGVEFAVAWPDRFRTKFGGVPAFVISRQHLIDNKKAAARLQDLADVEQLEATLDQT
jgi:hypothetical protein